MEEDKLPSKKHVQVPNNMTKKSDLEPRDLLVYANIKKYINYETKETFVGLETIAKDCKFTIPTVRKSINILKEKGYISVSKKGRSNVYKFNKYKNFEPFSYEFLEGEQIESNEKAYIITAQAMMFKDVEGYGKITYDNKTLGEMINLSPKTIQRLDKSLMAKGFLSIVKTSSIDAETGLKINEKIFHLNELEQAVIWTLQKHDEDIQELKEVTSTTAKDVKIVLSENVKLKQELDLLKERLNNLENKDLLVI